MGNRQPGGGRDAGNDKKDEKDKKKKYEPPVPTRIGKKEKAIKGSRSNQSIATSFATHSMSFETAALRANQGLSLNGRRVY